MTSPDALPAWLPIASCADTKILHLSRQADALCCNSYVISAATALLVIDPGAHGPQTARIRQALADELAAKKRPVLFLLTHCHHDHSRALEFWTRQQEYPVTSLAHEDGAAALKIGDSERTLSYIFSQDFPCVSIDCPIAFTGSGPLPVAEGIELSGAGDWKPNYPVRTRQLRLGKDLALELYHTPGHSPDSLCYRLGGLLFIGDLLLADKPGVAGIPGWSQPRLLESLRFMELLLSEGAITGCCPGHGAPLDAADVLRMLQGAFKNTRRLNRLICFDDRRLDFLKTCAVALAREAALQLAVLGGRLHLAAHRLDELGEEQLARELVRSIDLDAMETFLVKFQDFTNEHARDAFRAAIPLRGVAMMGRIAGLLAASGLPQGIADIAVRRVDLLLRDYINIVAGLDLRDFLAPADAARLVQAALATFTSPEPSEADIDAAADSPELFGLFLARRLYRLPDARGIAVRAPAAPLPQVLTEPERLTQLFIDCIEQLASLAGKAAISFRHDAQFVTVCLSAPAGADCLNDGKIRYYGYMMELLGGSFTHGLTGEDEQACFRIPVCS